MTSTANQSTKINYEVAIIGAGFAGLGAGIRLKQRGDNSFVIFERAGDVGGTWRDNTYPGCACDIPSFLYSYSFEPNPEWSRSFSPQEEILGYLKNCVKKYDLNNHLRMNTEIMHVQFDKENGFWRIKDGQGKETTARIVISAAGPFNAPFIPKIKGQSSFKGETFHSLTWNHDYDLTNKKVAVIGTGASAIQFVPQIAPMVKELFVYQRTAPYIAPKMDKELGEKAKSRFRKYPWYQRFWREIIYWVLENNGRSNEGDNKMRAKRKKIALDHLNHSITDPKLKEKLTPNYKIGCKRILISDDYYPTLERPNVKLIPESANAICEEGILNKDGSITEVDVIIYGTGFYATKFTKVFSLIGEENKNLFETWNEQGGEAYYGMTVSGFPNLCFMVGPNTGLGHNSIIHMMESQLNYILSYIDMARKTEKSSTYFDLKPAVQKAFNEKVQKKLANMVWSAGGCKSYYLKNMDGKNTSIWPGSTVSFRRQTKEVNPTDYMAITGNSSTSTLEEEELAFTKI